MILTFFRRILFLFLFAGIFTAAQAQEYKYEIGAMPGAAFYMGDANKNGFFKDLNPAFGAVFRYNANFRWAFKANMTWAKVSGSTNGQLNVFPNHAEGSFSRNFVDMGGQMEFNFFPYSEKYAYANAKRFSPYIFAGLGMTVSPAGKYTFVGPNIPLGVGVKYKLRNRINLGFEFSFRKLFGDGFDVTKEENAFLDDPYHIGGSFLKNKDWYSFMLFCVSWDFGPRNRVCNSINSNSSYR